MVLIVFKNSLEPEVLEVLEAAGVSAFTSLPKVTGVGEAGTALGSFAWPGFNSIILAALDESQTSRLVSGLRAFRDRASTRQRGASIPVRVFVLPCTQAV